MLMGRYKGKGAFTKVHLLSFDGEEGPLFLLTDDDQVGANAHETKITSKTRSELRAH